MNGFKGMLRAGGSMALAILAVSAAPAAAQLSQRQLDGLADRIGYRWEVVDNAPANCPAEIRGCFLSTLTLTTPDVLPPDLREEDLSLFFSFVNPLPRVESDTFQHEWINGDLQRLSVRKGVKLRPSTRYTIKLWGQGSHFSTAHVMPNAFLTAPKLQARTIAASRTTIDPETGLEKLPFVAPMTDEARLATKGPPDVTRWMTPDRVFSVNARRAAPAAVDLAVLPRPAEVKRPQGELLDVSKGLALELRGVARTALEPSLAALENSGARLGKGGAPLAVHVDPASGLPAEGYLLEVSGRGISVTAPDVAGANHALRSLTQQVSFEGRRLRPLRIKDSPRYGFRGVHVDLGRNFHSKEALLKLTETMAAYKLNKLHLHLADDEGWRLEIAGLPELTEVGARRCYDPSERRCLLPQLGSGVDERNSSNGFLSRSDYVEIVRAAAARNIEVIPSIDMPGHSRAAIRAMEARHARFAAAGDQKKAAEFRLVDPEDRTQYRSIQHYTDNTLNVCMPSTYRFIDAVVDDIAAMHRSAGVPLRTFHLGADETAGAWKNSPACKDMIASSGGEAARLTPRFIERVATMLSAKGLQTAGWSDGLGHTASDAMPRNVQTNIWGTLHTTGVQEAHEQANRGWKTVLSIPDLGYFDMPYAPHPEENGYDWATRGVDSYQVFAFIPDNLPANAALITNIKGSYQPLADTPPLGAGRGVAGLQAQLWSETIRTDAMMEHMLFPRLLALAERAWSPAPWQPAYRPGTKWLWQDARVANSGLTAAWRDFSGRLAAQLPSLEKAGIAYRLAPPGARIVAGVLEANTEFPGTPIEYRQMDGAWTRYTGPVRLSGDVQLRTRTRDGLRASRTVDVRLSPDGVR